MEETRLEKARASLGEIVEQARVAETPTRITRHGKPAAVVVPVDWYEQAVKVLGTVNLMLQDEADGLEWQSGMHALRDALHGPVANRAGRQTQDEARSAVPRPPVITDDTPVGPDVDLDTEVVLLPSGTRLTDELIPSLVEEIREKTATT